jgi:hypothetical protein
MAVQSVEHLLYVTLTDDGTDKVLFLSEFVESRLAEATAVPADDDDVGN